LVEDSSRRTTHMAGIDSLTGLLVDELKDQYDAEKRLS
jgi:hypothetical protein